VDWDSSAVTATRYGLDGLGIVSRWGARFSAPVQTDPGAHPASCAMGTGSLSREVKGRGVALPTKSHLRLKKVKERVELNVYFPSGPSWPVLG